MRHRRSTQVADRKHRRIGKFSLNQRELFRIGRRGTVPIIESPDQLLRTTDAWQAPQLVASESTKGNQP